MSRGRLNNKYAMPEYDIPAYDGKMLNYKNHGDPVSEWRKDKGLHHFEEIAKKKSLIPPPNKYDNMHISFNIYSFSHTIWIAGMIYITGHAS